jgi:hypothetical protein
MTMITGASGAIPRHDWVRMDAHAKMFYEQIRKRKTDVNTIAKNTGFSTDDMKKIKKHLFFNEYDLGDEMPSRFDPHYDITVSWQRLIDGKDIKEMDIILLHHELTESNLMNEQGMDYTAAHQIAEQTYNYSGFIKELDRKEGLM